MKAEENQSVDDLILNYIFLKVLFKKAIPECHIPEAAVPLQVCVSGTLWYTATSLLNCWMLIHVLSL